MNDEVNAVNVADDINAEVPLVSISCLTYNHKNFIRQSIESVLMQKTNFRFELIIHDDCSTDGTTEIIREYAAKHPDIIKPYYEETNQYTKHPDAFQRFSKLIRANSPCKYFASIEGDDYWKDPLKLQKQVDFLEANPEYGFVGTGFVYLVEDGDGWKEQPGPEGGDYVKNWNKNYGIGTLNAEESGNMVLYGNVFEFAKIQPVCQTVSIVYRKKLIKGLEGKLSGDWVSQAIMAHNSKYAFMKDVTCVYRVHHDSIIHDNSYEGLYRHYNWRLKNRKMLAELFPGECEDPGKDQIDYVTYLRLRVAIKSFNYKEARQCKREITTDSIKSKRYYKLFKGPVSFVFLNMALKMTNPAKK